MRALLKQNGMFVKKSQLHLLKRSVSCFIGPTCECTGERFFLAARTDAECVRSPCSLIRGEGGGIILTDSRERHTFADWIDIAVEYDAPRRQGRNDFR